MPKSPHPPHVSNSDPTFPVSDPPRSSPTSLSQAIMLFLNGDTIPHIFITIIHYALPSEDHTVQKLLLLYLEIIDKTNSKGKVLSEMILICQNLCNNLRFLCRLNEFEIIELLIPSILANLEHRHPFVRRNVVLAIMLVPVAAEGDVVGQRTGREWRRGRWVKGRRPCDTNVAATSALNGSMDEKCNKCIILKYNSN
ncbi:hypothetical protein ACFX2I_015790 [Malus domestica]